MGVMLSVKDLVVNYGAINAIKGISFDVNEGEIVTLIGANGAGKTTTLHAVSRLLKPKQGEISFCGQPISSMEAHKIIQLGLTQVPEGRRVFSQLTVQQNLALGAYTRKDGADAVAADYEMVFQRLPRLKERRRQIAATTAIPSAASSRRGIRIRRTGFRNSSGRSQPEHTLFVLCGVQFSGRVSEVVE